MRRAFKSRPTPWLTVSLYKTKPCLCQTIGGSFLRSTAETSTGDGKFRVSWFFHLPPPHVDGSLYLLKLRSDLLTVGHTLWLASFYSGVVQLIAPSITGLAVSAIDRLRPLRLITRSWRSLPFRACLLCCLVFELQMQPSLLLTSIQESNHLI